MSCHKPLTAYLPVCAPKGIKPSFKPRKWNDRIVKLPCGRCLGCRAARAKEWAIRIMHEADMHDQNCMITLTYSDAWLPADRGLHKEDYQKFLKRLRKAIAPVKIKYYLAGEYGTDENELNGIGRPHYHVIIFGYDFPDKYKYKVQRGNTYFRSEMLEKRIWPYGFSDITNVSYKSAAYVARYVMKKINGHMSSDHYRRLDKESGETWDILPEFNAMSLKPAISLEWFEQFSKDVYPDDFVVMDGKKQPTPRYYAKLLEKKSPEDSWLARCKRFSKMMETGGTLEDEKRRKNRSVIQSRQHKFLKRELK